MKKNLLYPFLIFNLSFLIPFLVSAQYAKLLDFSGANGSKPYSSLISDGNFLYGMTSKGGANDSGTIFKIKLDGTGYVKLFDFSGADGFNPHGSLISDGTFLYGMTSEGGANSDGVIFKIKHDGTGYSRLLDFAGINGSNDHKGLMGSFISDGTYLYDMTQYGGTAGFGTVFKIKHDGTGYSKLLDFAGANGTYPSGSLISDGAFLYGMTAGGGMNDWGTVFKIKQDGSGYSKLFDFAGTTNGGSPQGSLISIGGFLFGMTSRGGTDDAGVIFKIQHDGSGYSKLFDFTGINGGYPGGGSLITDGTFLYGMTRAGGTNSMGTIFKIMPDGTEHSILLNFESTAHGSSPLGSLISDGIFLYGMAYGGGLNDEGTLFKYCLFNISTTTVGDSICSNQCNGSASINATGGTPPFTYAWSTSPVQTASIATGLCPGTYTVTVNDNFTSAVDTVQIISFPQPTSPPVCVVTVDSISQYNIIVWEKTGLTNVDSFIIYREYTTNNYVPIGAISFDSLSQFIDTVRTKYFPITGDPNVTSYRYKLQIRDTCGNYSALSLYHNTVHMINNNGNFQWNSYEIENTSNQVTFYNLKRDNFSNGNWITVAGVSGSQNSITDSDYATWASTANWRIETQWNISCTPSIKNIDPFAVKTTKSNTNKRVTPAGINTFFSGDAVSIYPNPNNGEFTIMMVNNKEHLADVELYNTMGEKMYSDKMIYRTSAILQCGLPSGIYFAHIKTQNSISVKKIVINR